MDEQCFDLLRSRTPLVAVLAGDVVQGVLLMEVVLGLSPVFNTITFFDICIRYISLASGTHF